MKNINEATPTNVNISFKILNEFFLLLSSFNSKCFGRQIEILTHLVTDPWVRFPGPGLRDADPSLPELKQDLAVVFRLSTALPRAERRVTGGEREGSRARRRDAFRARTLVKVKVEV